MANWTILKEAIAGVIKTNDNQEITGAVLQSTLNSIVNIVGENATFAGIATPSTNPGAPDGPIFYLATTPGVYSNFNGIQIADGEAVILQWKNNTWAKESSGLATEQEIIYDVSARNGGVIFESISALLSSSNLGELIPTSVRHGGMSIRFIQSSVSNSDNKYVQYRLMADDWSTTVTDWLQEANTNNTSEAWCTTAGNVSDKVIDLTGFVLSKDIKLTVHFDSVNTANDVTLNINNTGARPLYYGDSRMSSSNTFVPGEILDITYEQYSQTYRAVSRTILTQSLGKNKKAAISQDAVTTGINVLKGKVYDDTPLNIDVVGIKNKLNIKGTFLRGVKFEIGSLDASGEIDYANKTRAFSAFVPVEIFYIINNDSKQFCIFEYNSDDAFVRKSSWTNKRTLDNNTSKVRFLIRKSNDSVISEDELPGLVDEFVLSTYISNNGADLMTITKTEVDKGLNKLVVVPSAYILGVSNSNDEAKIYPSTQRIVNRFPFKCTAQTIIKNDNYDFNVIELDEQGDYISGSNIGWIPKGTPYHILNSNCSFVYINIRKDNDATITEGDVYEIASALYAEVDEAFIYNNIPYSGFTRSGVNASGEVVANPTRICSPAIPCNAGDWVYCANNYDFCIAKYDTNNNFIGITSWKQEKTRINVDGYIRVALRKTSQDAQINLYEVYNLALNVTFEKNKYIENETQYVTEYHNQEDSLRQKYSQNIDSNTFSFVILADTHHPDPFKGASLETATIARKLSETLGVDAIIHLGDMITEHEPYATENVRLLEEYMSRHRSYIPFLYAIGHHEMYEYDSTTDTWSLDYKKLLGQTSRFTRYIKQEFDTNNHANFYIDAYNSNLRFVFVDSIYKKWGFTNATIAWVQSILAISSGKKLCFFSHVPLLTRATYMGQESWAEIINGDELHAILKNWINSGGDILAWFHGHTHVDNIVKDNDMYFPLISTACGLCKKMNDEGGMPISGNPAAPDREYGTYSQYCMDIVNIHPDTNTINMYRFGAGGDRTYSANS